MPMRRHARRMRSAISPRLAMRTLREHQATDPSILARRVRSAGRTRSPGRARHPARPTVPSTGRDDLLADAEHVDEADRIARLTLSRPPTPSRGRSSRPPASVITPRCRARARRSVPVARSGSAARCRRLHVRWWPRGAATRPLPFAIRPAQADAPAVLAHLQLAEVARWPGARSARQRCRRRGARSFAIASPFIARRRPSQTSSRSGTSDSSSAARGQRPTPSRR